MKLEDLPKDRLNFIVRDKPAGEGRGDGYFR